MTLEWLVQGTTNLLPKKEETWIPKNYRPIACLPTTFKILTSVITDRLYNHLEKESIMTPEQRGGKKDCYQWRIQDFPLGGRQFTGANRADYDAHLSSFLPYFI